MWGSADGTCPHVSGSKTTADSSAPLEREQQAFTPKHCIMHSPFSALSVPLPFPHPLPLSPTDLQLLTPTHRLTTARTLPSSISLWLRASAMVEKHKAHLRIWNEKEESSLPCTRLICGLSVWPVPLGTWERSAGKQPELTCSRCQQQRGQLDIASAWGDLGCHPASLPAVRHWRIPVSLGDSSAWCLQHSRDRKQRVSSSFRDYSALDWTALGHNSKMQEHYA